MKDPYQVLGVSPTADDDEIKSAYRALARKYHPDKYRDSDLAEMAGEKMKEINAAYDEIQKMRSGKSAGHTAYGYNPGAGQGNYGEGSPFLQARRLINLRRIPEAEMILDSVAVSDRGAEWYFLMGCVSVYKGFYVDAQQYFDTACGMDPTNAEYRDAQNRLRQQTQQFGGKQPVNGRGCSVCDLCMGMMCVDMCCDSSRCC